MRLLMGASAHTGQILFWAADNCLYPSPSPLGAVPIGVAQRNLSRNEFVLVGSEQHCDVLVVSVDFPV